MEISGPIGSSGCTYDVQIDAALNVVVAVKMPLAGLINGEVAKANSPLLTSIVQIAEQAGAAYVASKAPAAAPAAV